MQVFDENHIRKIVLVGGAKSGKTTLAETMLYEAKVIQRRGSVEQKNTVSDFHEIEHERGISVYATPLHTEWRNYKINIIDTPGLDDFIGEIVAPLRVADTAVLLFNAAHGVEVGTELVWNYVDRFRKPVIFVINQLDHPLADFDTNNIDGNSHGKIWDNLFGDLFFVTNSGHFFTCHFFCHKFRTFFLSAIFLSQILDIYLHTIFFVPTATGKSFLYNFGIDFSYFYSFMNQFFKFRC
jgi:small GTP-binding protein